MKRFLAVFVGSPAAMDRWMALPEDERKQRERRGVADWHRWVDDHRNAIVEIGGPLSRTKQVNAAGISDIRNAMGAYTVVQAESQDAAAQMFLDHPHFTVFPGEAVEVMEVMPIPPK